MGTQKIRISIATDEERETIYSLRHRVYACEMSQHPANASHRLQDRCDAFNIYLSAEIGGEVCGCISITPPGDGGYSLDKYLPRSEMPFPVDATTYEVRLLTVAAARRGRSLAALLMYAAFRFVEARGGACIIGMGRHELRGFYADAGLSLSGRQVQSGAVRYELMSAAVSALRKRLDGFTPLLVRLHREAQWDLDFPFFPETACTHGGASFEAVGNTFETLHRRDAVINADVLDAWFPPAPGVLGAVAEHLPWLLQTSPPVGAEGLIQTISEVRGVARESLVAGAGSSSLIYLAFRHWLYAASRVLLPDPTYGEYAHVLERVVGCHVDRFPLARRDGYALDLNELAAQTERGRYDLLVLVNPNNPTGGFVPREHLTGALRRIPERTRVWVDEAYIDYIGPDVSIEQYAARSRNVIVCKSLSKSLALSGARAAYLCGPSSLIQPLRALSPPWAVSLPAQVAAVAALRDPAYYARRYAQTHALRWRLHESLARALPEAVLLPSPANWLLCHLSSSGPEAELICGRCRAQDVFLRDVASISARFGSHTLRIAVKDEPDNGRIVAALTQAMDL